MFRRSTGNQKNRLPSKSDSQGRRPSARRRKTRKSTLQALEKRNLLTVYLPTVALEADQLVIDGSDFGDEIRVWQDASNIRVSIDTPHTQLSVNRSFPAWQVNQVHVFARGGNDTIANETNRRDFIYAGEGNDTVVGGSSDSLIKGGAGDDTINGSAGNDEISGEAGNDTIDGSAGDDVIFGHDVFEAGGIDSVRGGDGNDTIDSSGGPTDAGPGNDVVKSYYGGVIHLGDGDDTAIVNQMSHQTEIHGGDGADSIRIYYRSSHSYYRITGGAGNDSIVVDDEAGGFEAYGFVDGGDGDDRIHTSHADGDEIHGGAGDDFIIDAGGNDNRIFGGSGDDYIRTGDGRNTLFGESGNDVLIAGHGVDVLNGGPGRDYLDGGGSVFDYDFQNSVLDPYAQTYGPSIELAHDPDQLDGGSGYDVAVDYLHDPEIMQGMDRITDHTPDRTRGLAAADFDGDGVDELYTAVTRNGFSEIYRSNESGTFGTLIWSRLAADYAIQDIDAGDVDGDGSPELYVALEDGDGRAYLYRSETGESLGDDIWSSTNSTWTINALAVGDVDSDDGGDAAAELFVGLERSDGSAYLYRSDTGQGLDTRIWRKGYGRYTIQSLGAGVVNGQGALFMGVQRSNGDAYLYRSDFGYGAGDRIWEDTTGQWRIQSVAAGPADGDNSLYVGLNRSNGTGRYVFQSDDGLVLQDPQYPSRLSTIQTIEVGASGMYMGIEDSNGEVYVSGQGSLDYLKDNNTVQKFYLTSYVKPFAEDEIGQVFSTESSGVATADFGSATYQSNTTQTASTPEHQVATSDSSYSAESQAAADSVWSQIGRSWFDLGKSL